MSLLVRYSPFKWGIYYTIHLRRSHEHIKNSAPDLLR